MSKLDGLNDLLFPQEVKKCLVCYCPVGPHNSTLFNRASSGFLLGHGKITRSPKYPRYSTKTIIGKQLHIIFILKNVLDLPTSQLEKYLRHAGDPENWFKLCDKCSEDMEHVKTIYKELQRLTVKFEEAKWQIQEKMSASSSLYFPFVEPEIPPPPPRKKKKGDSSGGGSGGKRASVSTTSTPPVSRPVRKEFDIVENCRFIVGQRSGMPPPLILSSNPFYKGDDDARQLAGHPDPTDGTGSDYEPDPDPIGDIDRENPSPATSTTKSAPETDVMMLAEPEREMAVLMKMEPEFETGIPSPADNNMDMEEEQAAALAMEEGEPDFAYAPEDGEELPKFGEKDDEEGEGGQELELKYNSVELQGGGVPLLLEEFKDGVPCPLCNVQQLRYQNMGQSCRHLQSCLDAYQGRMRYLFCPICKKFKCKVKEIREFGEHLQLCRDGQQYTEAVPLEQKIFSCKGCLSKGVDCQYLQYTELLKHLYRYHQHSYACTKCPSRFETLQDCTVTHWKLKHSDDLATIPAILRFQLDHPPIPDIPWCCPMCFKKFPEEALRDKHVDSCPEMEDQLQPDRSFKCEVKSCGREYFWEEEVKIHEVIVHAKPYKQDKSWFCDQCNKYFLTEDRVKTHSITLSLSKWLYNVAKKCNLLNN